MAQVLVTREMMGSVGVLNAAAPGNLGVIGTGTWYKRAVGPWDGSTADPGWSADVRRANFDSHWDMTGAPYNAARDFGCVGFWVRFTNRGTAAAAGQFSILFSLSISGTSNRLIHFGTNAAGDALTSDNGGGTSTNVGFFSLHAWYYCQIEWKNINASSIGYIIKAKPLGGAFTTLKDRSAGYNPGGGSQIQWAHLRNDFTGAGGNWDGRIGGIGLYSITAFGDGAPPGDLHDPVETRRTWYVNPSTGNDNNTGIAANAAWQTSTKLADELNFSGVMGTLTPWMDSAGHTIAGGVAGSSWIASALSGISSNGDTVMIDTSVSPLSITESLIINNRCPGLHITSATSDRADIRAYKAVGGWSKTAGQTNIYESVDTEATVVLWEDLKWLNHPVGANFAAVAASLDATPGSFWTDGTKMYVHPFGNTNPSSDGKSYVRSRLLGGAGFNAITVTPAADVKLSRLKVGGTAVVSASVNDFPAATNHYCIEVDANNNIVSDCYCYYGAKHTVGVLAGLTNLAVYVENVEANQGPPWIPTGGATAFVTFSSVSTGMISYWNRCSCLKNIGVIGDTAGTVNVLYDVLLTHSSGAGVQWSDIFVSDCNFPGMVINQSDDNVTNGYTITNTRFGGGVVHKATVNRCLLDYAALVPAAAANSVTILNSILTPLTQTPSNSVGGFRAQGTLTIEGCTIDMRSNPTTGTNAFLFRFGTVTLTFKNNIFINKPGTNTAPVKDFASTDTVNISNNVYLLGASNFASLNYNDGSTTIDRTFAQWQALGKDANSKNTDPLLTTFWKPLKNSPAINAAIDLGTGASVDFSGRLFPLRVTAGAYEFTKSGSLRLKHKWL